MQQRMCQRLCKCAALLRHAVTLGGFLEPTVKMQLSRLLAWHNHKLAFGNAWLWYSMDLRVSGRMLPILCAVSFCGHCLQVRWIGFRDCWVTAADGDLLRLWSTAGKKVEELAYKGGPCR